jgi:hypothetical protein
MITKCTFSKHAAECEKYVCTPYQHKLLAVPVILHKWDNHNSRICNCSISTFWQFLDFLNLQANILMSQSPYIALHFRTGSRFCVRCKCCDTSCILSTLTSRTAQVFMPPHSWSRATCAAHSNSSLFLLTNKVILSCHLQFSWMTGHNFSIFLTYKCGTLGMFRAPWVKVYYS